MVVDYNNPIFSNISDIEKSICSINTTVLKLYLTPYCSFSSGNCVLIEQIPEVIFNECLSLPRSPNNSNFLLFLRKNDSDISNFFFARKKVVLKMLTYLKINHPSYHSVSINNTNLENLKDLIQSNTITSKKVMVENKNPNFNDEEYSNNYNISITQRPTQPININEISPLPQDSIPSVLSYESTDSWMSKNFFYLFPNGKGDCTKIGRRFTVPLKEAMGYYLSLGAIDNKGCKFFPFQSDNSFISVCFLAINKMAAVKNLRFLFRNGAGEDFSEENFTRAVNDPQRRDILYKKIYTVTRSYQNSWANLKQANTVLSEICRSQSLPNLFITLSEANHRWGGDMKRLLCGENHEWDSSYKNQTDLVKKIHTSV